MGFDVRGRKPTAPEGKYFHNNIWWWPPLWAYCLEVAPDIAGKVTYAFSNDGDGLDEADALALAARLREELESGRTAEFERQYMSLKTSELCPVCAGTGVVEKGEGAIACLSCRGQGIKHPPAVDYPFSEENVRQFAKFLENCGGFEIW